MEKAGHRAHLGCKSLYGFDPPTLLNGILRDGSVQQPYGMEAVQVTEASFLFEVRIQLAIILPLTMNDAISVRGPHICTDVTYLFPPRLLLVLVALMDQEMVCQDIIRHAAQIDFKQARGLVRAISRETFIAPE